MGFHESKSLLYLKPAAFCLQRGNRVQGTQNGGIDGSAGWRRPFQAVSAS